MKMNNYQEKAMRTFNTELNDFHAMLYAALKLTGEAGEVSDYIGKWVGQGHNLDMDRLIEELGDVLWYIALFSKLTGVSLQEIADRNIEKLERRYPQGFSVEKSLNRGSL
jgi:NTP pyrophosphatase (non-canonical NTP hydrolase)